MKVEVRGTLKVEKGHIKETSGQGGEGHLRVELGRLASSLM